MDSMRVRRVRLGLSLTQLYKICGINNNILDQLERGLRTPNRAQRVRLSAALGGEFYFEAEREDIQMLTNVPKPPEMKWTAAGKPDYSHLDDEKPSVLQQLQQELTDQYGEANVVIRHMAPEYCFFEVLSEGRQGIFSQPYEVDDDGEASLDGYPEEVEAAEFAVLNRRRVPRTGVPDPQGEDE